MNLVDLRIFVSAARRPSLGAAAVEMHLTPSAVSKAIKRLEDSLEMPLFDRSAKQLVLNDSGYRLLDRAQALLALADQARLDLMGERAELDCRIGGAAVLLWRHGRALARQLEAYPQASLRLQPMFEEEALAALARGEIAAALVTSKVIDGQAPHWSPHWAATDLGILDLHLMAGKGHPLARKAKSGATTQQVLAYDFACPPRNLFCGMQRGARSDGWRDDQLPRKIRYWTEDLQLLLGFVKSGEALAYLPDFALEDQGLVRIKVSDCAFTCSERIYLVWDDMTAPAWLRALAGAV